MARIYQTVQPPGQVLGHEGMPGHALLVLVRFKGTAVSSIHPKMLSNLSFFGRFLDEVQTCQVTCKL